VASPIVRETIKKLKARRAELQRQIKGPIAELRQIESDLEALSAVNGRGARASASAPRVSPQPAILRAIRNGATTPEEIATKTGLALGTVKRSVTMSVDRHKLVVRGRNGLTLTQRGRDRLRELERR
jgi:DNA-binding NarL/FixJ family response regulator